MATIKEIAKYAGVSVATVSYVLNGTKKLSPETTARVNEAIRILNYTPNTIAKTLRNGQTRTIGVLIEDIRCTPTPEILNGIAATLEKQGYQMLVHDLHLYEKIQNQYDEITHYIDHIHNGIALLKQSMVAGMIYVSMHMRRLDLVLPLDLPFIYAYACCNTHTSHVMYDDVESATQMTQYLIDLGHHSIGIISGPTSSYAAQKRLEGILATLNRNAVQIPTSFIKLGDWEYESGYQCALELLHSPQRPSALFALNDIMAAGAYKACYECHVQIPRDMTLVGFDNREISKYLQPPLTTMNLPLKEIGEQSALFLTDSLSQAPQQSYQQIIMPCHIIQRQSSSVYVPQGLVLEPLQ